jgi:hypothetical protein
MTHFERRISVKLAIGIFIALLSTSAVADCTRLDWQSPLPGVHDLEANAQQMSAAREAVAVYVADSQAYLECARPEPFLHNYIVSRMEQAASGYNQQRKQYFIRNNTVALQ